MEQEMQLFTSQEFGAVRVVTMQDGTPWFAGKDVAPILGYRNASKALADHVAKEDKKLDNNSLLWLGQRGGWLINESGLYSLVLSSRLPAAKAFKRWITTEVLPAIRRTGMYATNQLLDDPDLALEAFAALKAERQKRLAAEEQLATCLPKVQYADAVCASRSSILVGDLAKLLKQNGVDIGQNRLFAYLRENGYLMRQGARRNMPTQKSMELGLFETRQTVIVSPGGSVRLSRTPKVTGKGQLYFIRHFQQRMS